MFVLLSGPISRTVCVLIFVTVGIVLGQIEIELVSADREMSLYVSYGKDSF